ncbi:uncharacterized protein LOC122577105 [Bombus pyrosoma]|uniref:uncharacterized protein LOC122577105 n=1 Tax=Bombus pyrosoma TaxID=396416 RepID=UPI001CB90551|nr:uncharacterized protein LOC122577105 [Bombus pyrosoma]
MRYLGLDIDSQWTFEPHFDSLISRATAAANALCGLLPNISGAGVAVRRLCEGVDRSRVMYGAPVWADDLMARRRSILLLRRLHRVTAVRIVRGYRTVSHASATVLVASPPWKLRALVLKKRYEQRRPWDPAEQAASDDLGTAEEDAWDQWRSQMINEAGEHRSAAAVLPNWGTWRSRRGLPLTFRMTQIVTGHGVFGEYLKKIGRKTTDIGHHCGEGRDTAQHTLEACLAWELPRYTLRQVIGERLTPSAIIAPMLSGPQEYEAVRLFCERVMLAKERAERVTIGLSTIQAFAWSKRREDGAVSVVGISEKLKNLNKEVNQSEGLVPVEK